VAARGEGAAASNAGAKPRRPSRPAFSLSDNAAYAKNGGFMRKPPEPRKSASTGKTAAALGFVFVFVLRLDLLLLLQGGLFARNRLKQWRGAVRVLVQQSLSDLRHL
jgi:hypothetical protein